MAESPTMRLEAGQGVWLLGVLLAFAGGWLALRLKRAIERRARKRRAARAQHAEREAAGLLEARGFRVLGRQVRQSWGLIADGQELRFTLIADYLVQRHGQRWVAEVKTGERALDLRHGPTRRQLLEYRAAFAVAGVLLVDAEGQTLRRVHFPDSGQRPPTARLLVFGAGLVVGSACAAYWLSLG